VWIWRYSPLDKRRPDRDLRKEQALFLGRRRSNFNATGQATTASP